MDSQPAAKTPREAESIVHELLGELRVGAQRLQADLQQQCCTSLQSMEKTFREAASKVQSDLLKELQSDHLHSMKAPGEHLQESASRTGGPSKWRGGKAAGRPRAPLQVRDTEVHESVAQSGEETRESPDPLEPPKPQNN
eukprot:5367739-Amphidinium_carterae.1